MHLICQFKTRFRVIKTKPEMLMVLDSINTIICKVQKKRHAKTIVKL